MRAPPPQSLEHPDCCRRITIQVTWRASMQHLVIHRSPANERDDVSGVPVVQASV